MKLSTHISHEPRMTGGTGLRLRRCERQILDLVMHRRLSARVAAARLGLPLAQAERHLARALHKLDLAMRGIDPTSPWPW